MSDLIVEVLTPEGIKVGSFKNAEVKMLSRHHYLISGHFFEATGQLAEKIEFNPQVLPYIANISQVSQCTHTRLAKVYVQRGRQPIEMIGVCEELD